MTRDQLMALSVSGKGGLREIARQWPELRGAFAASAGKDLLVKVLSGEVSKEDALREFAQSIASGVAAPAEVVLEDTPMGQVEQIVVPEPPVGDTVVVEVKGGMADVLKAASTMFGENSRFVLALKQSLEASTNAEQRLEAAVKDLAGLRENYSLASKAVEAAKEELAKTAKERDDLKAMAVPTPPKVTLLENGASTVSICGVEAPVFTGADPTLVPPLDPHYDFKSWRSVLQAGSSLKYGTKEVLSALLAGERVMLVGPPGCGKTSWAEQVAALMQMPCFRINLSDHMTDDSFVGTWVAANGSTQFVHGVLPKAMRCQPGALVILDELDHASASCTSVLHSVLEPGGKLVIPANFGEVVVPGDKLRFLATCNTQGLGDVSGAHTNAKVQDAALLSRWTCCFHVGWMSPAKEVGLLVRSTGIDPNKAELVVKVATDVREAFAKQEVSAPMTLRQTPAWCRLALSWGGDPEAWAKAFGTTVLAKLPAEERAAVSAIAQRHWGNAIDLS